MSKSPLYPLLLLVLIYSCSTPATSDPNILVQEGFIVEKLYSPSENSQGSWVSITKDNQGRLIASDQYGALYYIQVPKLGSKEAVKVDSIPVNIGKAHGLLWAHNSLYVMKNSDNQEESGLYRVTDSDGDGQLDHIDFLQQFVGRGEHGPHGIVLGPDGYLYMLGGNHTLLPKKFNSVQKPVWDEDQLFDAIKDPRGHANEVVAPGGWLARTDKDGKDLTVIATGFRNAYDLAFNEDGELFTFDSDMEWDMGSPWYRPIRVCHIPMGAEFGWRTGSGKWPDYYPDNLPGILDIGQGSPTGVISGKTLDFPDRFKNGLFVYDWSFGTMYYITLIPEGASYRAEKEEFLSGNSLPLTDGIAGADGAMYFLTGGRRLESGLYRVYHPKNNSTASPAPQPVTEEQQLRRNLESFAMGAPADLALIWSSLQHPDRAVRYAARVALEYIETGQIEKKLSSETAPDALIQSAIALARIGETTGQQLAMEKLNSMSFPSLSVNQKTDLIRAYDLLFIRGDFGREQKQQLAKKLAPHYPTTSNQVNRELIQLLVYLGDSTAVPKTMAMLDTLAINNTSLPIIAKEVTERSEQYGGTIERMKSNTPPSELIHYAKALSYATTGWNETLREQYFKIFAKLFAANGGESYTGFLLHIRDQALSNVPEHLKESLRTLSGEELIKVGSTDLASLPQPQGPGKNYDIEEIVSLYSSADEHGNSTNGEKMYQAVLCSSCHGLQGSGSSVGPDLTQLSNRFSAKDIAEALVTPNKTISDQYEAIEVVMSDEKEYWGRLINETTDTLTLNTNPLQPQQLLKLNKKEIQSRHPSKRSMMMPALLNRLNEQEVMDLFAFLKSQAQKTNLQN